jgi:hypothetical protein
VRERRAGIITLLRLPISVAAIILISSGVMAGNLRPQDSGVSQGIQISNAAGAPLVVTKVMMEKKLQPDPLSATGTSPVISISLHNTTKERISAFLLTLNIASKFSTSFEPRVEIGPNGVYTLDATVPAGNPQDVVVKVAGVRFKNGSSWGSLSSPIR